MWPISVYFDLARPSGLIRWWWCPVNDTSRVCLITLGFRRQISSLDEIDSDNLASTIKIVFQ